MPSATAPLTALRTSGRLIVISSTFPRRSARTGSEDAAGSALICDLLLAVGKSSSLSATPRTQGARPVSLAAPAALVPLARRPARASPATARRQPAAAGREHRRAAVGAQSR